jgi:hypothetical protein
MKNFIIVVLILGLAFVAYKWYQSDRQTQSLNKEKTDQAKAVVTEAKEIQRKVNSQGIETVLYDIDKNKAPSDPAKHNIETKGIIDTTALALDIRTKQLQQILVVKATLEAENLKLKRQLDANDRPYYTYSGNGLNLKFTPPVNELDTNDQGTADFLADVSIKATQYWRRKWFLGARHSILAVSSNSKLFKINGADFVEFEQKQPSFGLRLQANGAFNTETGELSYGPALRVDLGRLSLQGRYSKYPNDPKWKTTFNASFDLLRF